VFRRPSLRDPGKSACAIHFTTTKLIGKMDLKEGMAISTSGNYEQFVEIEGKRYTHIIKPTTGLPVEGMAGVTVVDFQRERRMRFSTALFCFGGGGRRTGGEFPDKLHGFIHSRYAAPWRCW